VKGIRKGKIELSGLNVSVARFGTMLTVKMCLMNSIFMCDACEESD
jgi:hypothetical protein